MAAQSKLHRVSERSIKSLVKQLTDLYLRNRTRISRAVYLTFAIALIHRIHNAISEQKAASQKKVELRRRLGPAATAGDTTARRKVEINREFFKNLMRLLTICIPGWRSKELKLLISHSI